MNFNQHSELEGRHAFLSASKYHWIRYSDDKLINSFRTSKEAMRGTELHEFAAFAIRLRQKLPKVPLTLNMFVNDAIGFHMTPEQVLRATHWSFGTADAISYGPNYHHEDKRPILRIHDLKTGISKASFDQLMIYAAMFCLEYGLDPKDMDIELRIYQEDQRHIEMGDPEVIRDIMDLITHFTALIDDERKGVLL